MTSAPTRFIVCQQCRILVANLAYDRAKRSHRRFCRQCATMRASAAGKDAQRRQVQHVLGYPKEPHQVWSDDEISDAYARAGGLYGPMQ